MRFIALVAIILQFGAGLGQTPLGPELESYKVRSAMAPSKVATVQGTNYVAQSYNFEHVDWSVGSNDIALTSGVSDPFGGTDAYLLEYTDTEWGQLISADMADFVGYDGDICMSLYLRNVYKPGSMSIRFYAGGPDPDAQPRATISFASPTVEGSAISSVLKNADADAVGYTEISGGWWRVWCVFNPTTHGWGSVNNWDFRLMPFNGSTDVSNAVQAFGAQVEKASTPGPFIKQP